MLNTTNAPTRAIDCLGAVLVREEGEYCKHGHGKLRCETDPPNCEGTTRRPALYAVKFGEVWYIATASDLRDCTDRRSTQFVLATCPEMPAWWSPEQRFACAYSNGTRIATCAPTYPTRGGSDVARVITADLETGKEVPA